MKVFHFDAASAGKQVMHSEMNNNCSKFELTFDFVKNLIDMKWQHLNGYKYEEIGKELDKYNF